MNYKDVFAIASDNLKSDSEYVLKNYDCYEPKLDNEFYYKYFRRELFFEVSIMDIEEFLDFHFSICEKPDLLIKILERKLIIDAKTIIAEALVDFDTGGMYKEKDLGNDFIESEGVVYRRIYEFNFLLHITEFKRLHDSLRKRLEIIMNYIHKIDGNNNEGDERLKWISKPSHLAYIMRVLVKKEFIEPPILPNGTVNHAGLARQILNSFEIKNGTQNSLLPYLNLRKDRYFDMDQVFTQAKFRVPYREDI